MAAPSLATAPAICKESQCPPSSLNKRAMYMLFDAASSLERRLCAQVRKPCHHSVPHVSKYNVCIRQGDNFRIKGTGLTCLIEAGVFRARLATAPIVPDIAQPKGDIGERQKPRLPLMPPALGKRRAGIGGFTFGIAQYPQRGFVAQPRRHGIAAA